MREVPPAGVPPAASGGNHGRSLTAYAARQAGETRAHLRSHCLFSHKDRAHSTVRRRTSSSPATAMPMPWPRARRWIAESGALPTCMPTISQRLCSSPGTAGMRVRKSRRPRGLDTASRHAAGGGGRIDWRHCGLVYRPRENRRGVETGKRRPPCGTPCDARGRLSIPEAGGVAADSLSPGALSELMFPLAQRLRRLRCSGLR